MHGGHQLKQTAQGMRCMFVVVKPKLNAAPVEAAFVSRSDVYLNN